jgi:SAM-dependent methyltransferase
MICADTHAPGDNVPGTVLTARCPLDASRQCSVVSIGRFIDRSKLIGDVSVARCPRCGIGLSQPPLPDTSFLYTSRTSQDFHPGTGGIARFIKSIAFRRDAKALLASLGSTPACVIDFGCGSGLFTRCLAQSLPAGARVIATDFHAEPPNELGSVEYRSVNNIADLLGKADLVLAMHVVEHDDDPRKVIMSLIPLVRHNGHIVIEVPNIGCIWNSIFGRFWDTWYLPYHRVHFSRSALATLVEECGLSIVSRIDISIPTMGRTAANLVGRPNSLFFILMTAAFQPLQWIVERLTARPTALRVIARKR